MELNEIRQSIDDIDRELVGLFIRRMDMSAAVAQAKRRIDKPIRDYAREREILNRAAARAGDVYAPYVQALYSHIFDLSRSYQSAVLGHESPLAGRIADALSEAAGKRLPDHAPVACQGTEGDYARQACEKLFAHPDILYFDRFEGVFSAVEKGMCRYGILPIENSAAGSITQVYDLMEKHHFYIVGAQKLRIDYRLMRRRGDSTIPIAEIVSHGQALRQCSRFIAAHPQIAVTPMENIAKAAEYVVECGRDDVAVIAPRACADIYGLDTVNEDISDPHNNYTRFICISRNMEIYPQARRVSLMLNLAREPGALNAVVSRLAIAGVNLVKLESRPIPDRESEYRFFLDIIASAADPDTVRLLNELEAHCDSLVFLGCYDENQESPWNTV